MTALPRPRVVLLDLDHWDSLRSLAAALRRNGATTVRVTVARRGWRGAVARLGDRLAHGASATPVPRRDTPAPADERRSLFAPPTRDVQGPDDVLAQYRLTPEWPDVQPARRVPCAESADDLFDKLAMQRRAESLSLRVPTAWAPDPPPLVPLVVKGRLGFGGLSVRLAGSAAEVRAAPAELGGEVFYQEYRPGAVVNFGGVARDGRLLAGAAYRALPAADDPFGPPERIAVEDATQILLDLEVLLKDLSYSGFLCVDYIVSDDGRPAMIDFNPRIFASWLALQSCGVPVLEAYLSLLGIGTAPERVVGAPGCLAYVRTWPSRRRLESWRGLTGEATHVARSLAAVAALTGPRFVVATALRDCGVLAVAGARLAVRRLRTVTR